MNTTLASSPAHAQPPDPALGLTARLLARMFFRPAEVSENRAIAAGMHLITLQGPALRELRWAAGDKLQVRISPGLLTRTYTPILWDTEHGRTQLLAHALAVGPGSEWVRRASPGQPVSLFGPRRSLALSDIDPMLGVLVGDETAIGLAAAWRPSHAVIEAVNQPAIQGLLDQLQLPATAMAAQPDGVHLDALANAALGLATPDTRFVLAGRARTVQHVMRALRQHGVAPHRILTKAYWAEGKMGLD
ncbi:MAG: siderophore-interacting protein [Rubrivivax sp.]|nr:siderophore-interacting protein [Rubrivivax sp.]